jgi:DNA-binding Lrp family transcriptional regulator
MLTEEDLNDVDRWILDYLSEHGRATPHLLRLEYQDDADKSVSRQWISGRIRRLEEHGHIVRVHPDAYDRELEHDPREPRKA